MYYLRKFKYNKKYFKKGGQKGKKKGGKKRKFNPNS